MPAKCPHCGRILATAGGPHCPACRARLAPTVHAPHTVSKSAITLPVEPEPARLLVFAAVILLPLLAGGIFYLMTKEDQPRTLTAAVPPAHPPEVATPLSRSDEMTARKPIDQAFKEAFGTEWRLNSSSNKPVAPGPVAPLPPAELKTAPLSTPTSAPAPLQQSPAPAASLTGAQLYESARKSVVVIRTNRGALGSGFVIEGRRIVTNVHVIDGASKVQIKSSAGESAEVTALLAFDDAVDIAILPLPEKLDLPALSLGGQPPVGESVYAIGAPLGLEYTITQGIVSQIRTLRSGAVLLQTDTSISPGSSGGPLLNSRGEVVGVNTLGSRAETGANNLNFAVDVRHVRNACQKPKQVMLRGQRFKHMEIDEGFGDAGPGRRPKPSPDAPTPSPEPAEPDDAKAEVPEGMQRVFSQGRAFSLDVPLDWSGAARGQTCLLLTSAIEDRNDKFRESIAIERFSAGNLSLDDFYEVRYDKLGHLKKEIIKTIRGNQRIKLGGLDGKRLMYADTDAGAMLIEYLVKKDEHVYSLVAFVRTEDYDRWRKKLDAIFTSLKFHD